ncbi:MAG: hypothetical protein ACJ79R_21810 [Anaeromyxobacteraceae bacterium]
MLAITGCRREEVTHARVKRAPEAQAPTMGAGMGAMPPGAPGAEAVPRPPAPGQGEGLRWNLPKGWAQDAKSGGMRYATLKPASRGKIDVSVVVLPGPAGGELANVNRWRGQIGLAPLDEASLASSRKAVKAPAGSVSVYDFTSEGQAKSRMVAGLLTSGGNSWFVKMVGDAEAVGAARGDFMRLLESLRFD